MTGISQGVQQYASGISQQPDLRKFPGQVKDIINGIPDVTNGLYKRPGSKRIGSTPLASVSSGGSWFHYYRDETEGSYLGQVQTDGTLNVWRCSDGQLMTTLYGPDPVWDGTVNYTSGQRVEANDKVYEAQATINSGGSAPSHSSGTTNNWLFIEATSVDKTAVQNYLATSEPENLQFLTINDTTFVNNRDITVTTTGTTASTPDAHFAYVEILRAENGRQYSMNVYDNEATDNINRATMLKIDSDTLDESQGTGHCPGIGTQVFSVTAATSYTGTSIVNVKDSGGNLITSAAAKSNLIFRITTNGQQGRAAGSNDGEAADEYSCAYSRRVDLLHGGEGYTTGDTVTVTLDQAKDDYNYVVKVIDHETSAVKADIAAVRPAPTPFDAQTAVTVDTILGGIIDELSGTGITCTIIGNGIYMRRDTAFQVEIQDPDLMRVMQGSINEVSNLPGQCKDGYIVKLSNSQDSQDDDYYLKFEGTNGKDGPGTWVECAEPGIVKSFNASTMPHVIQRTGTTEFTVKQFTYPDRTVGDDNTNPIPNFVGKKINKVLFFRNRLAFLAGEYVVTCRAGTLGNPNFWSKTALVVSAADPIDISSSSMFPSDLFDGIEINTGLLVFSSNQQFLLSSDDTVLNPDTAKLRSVSTYNYNINIPPISTGVSIGYIDNSGKFSRFNEMINTQREGEPVVGETSKIVPSLLPKDIDLLTNSRENSLVLFGKTDSDIIYGYKYFRVGGEQKQSAWFTWKMNNPIKYHFIIDDEYYFLDTDNFLQKINLIQDDDPNFDQDSKNYIVHLDNWTTVGNGSYNDTTKLTTFANQSDWIDNVITPNNSLVLVDIDSATTRLGRYAECTVTNTDDFTVPGNWDWSEEWEVASTSINTSNEQLTLTTGSTDHGLVTADPVRYVEGDTAAAGLTDGTTYYAIKVDLNKIKLATNTTNANDGTAINITSQGTGTHKIQKLIPTLYIGYLYDYQVDFPRFYVSKTEGQNIKYDSSASLILHRVKFNFGKIGLYSTTLKRKGKSDYTEVYESTISDEYDVSDAPYLNEEQVTIPVYDRNTNVDIVLKSTHPAPATLISSSWEGDYTPMYYRRA